MANKIILKKSSVAGKVPTAGDLDVGEIAVNLTDKKLYSKDAGGTVVELGGGSGSGDVVGPASATDNAIARYDGTTGKLIQNSGAKVDDDGNVLVGYSTTPSGWSGISLVGINGASGSAISFGEAGTEAGYIKTDGTYFEVSSYGSLDLFAQNDLSLDSNVGKLALSIGGADKAIVNDDGLLVGYSTTPTGWGGLGLVGINGTAGAGISLGDEGTEVGYLFADPTQAGLWASANLTVQSQAGFVRLMATGVNPVQFETGSTIRFTINSSGALGIGATPAYGTSGQALLSAGNAAAPTWGDVQAPLVSGTNIKTINGASVLGSGDLAVSAVVPLGNAVFFASSNTFTPPVSGKYRITVVGGGGSGGVARGASARATGGGAGGISSAILDLSSSVTYTVTVANGGATVSRATDGATNGNAGGSSSFSGTGITTITATGGGAGQAATSGTAAGATGGSGSGGTVVITGGGSGSASGAGTGIAATGGGSVGWRGTGYASGNATVSSTFAAASGGAGIGGSSGVATSSTANTTTCGGGSGGVSQNITNAAGGTGGPAATTDTGILSSFSVYCNGVGGINATAPAAGMTSGAMGGNTAGAGGGATTGTTITSGTGTRFGGGGGAANTGTATGTVTAGSGANGSGSGACVTSAGATAASGNGGNGVVLIEWSSR